jgi:hypothetical protein
VSAIFHLPKYGKKCKIKVLGLLSDNFEKSDYEGKFILKMIY